MFKTSRWDTAVQLDVLLAASTGAHLINLKVGGASKFSADVVGNLATPGTVGYGVTANGSKSSGFTVNWAVSGSVQTATLAASTVTIAFTAPVATGTVLSLILYQDATGTRAVVWPATVIWPSGAAPTLTTTASRADVFTFLYNGTNYAGVTSGQNYASL